MSEQGKTVNFVQKSQISEFLVKFADFYRYRGLSEKTIERNWYNLRQFPKFIDGKEINKDSIRSYILFCKDQNSKSTNGLGKPRGLTTASVNSIISSTKQFIRWLWLEEGFLKDDISGCIKALKLDPFFPNLLTVEEIRTIINCPKEYDKWHTYIQKEYFDFFFELVACTGLRRFEAIGLDVGDLNFGEMVLHVRQAKFNKQRLVPIPTNLGVRLKEWVERRDAKQEDPLFKSYMKDSERMSPATIIDELKRRARVLGINKRVHLHLLRHCFITELIKSDAPAMKVARIVGHASLNSTLKYTHLVVDDLKDVIENHPLNKRSLNVKSMPVNKERGLNVN